MIGNHALRLPGAFETLAREGLGVLDVGARGGFHPIFKEASPVLSLVGFEPDAEECRRLTAASSEASRCRSVTYLPCALGAADGEHPLHLLQSRGCSSFDRPNPTFLGRFPNAVRFDVEATVSVPVRSLDSLMADAAVHLPKTIDFMKLDTNSSELDILRGARRTLREHVVAVEVEVEFARLYDGQPLFRDVDAFLDEAGFTLFKLRRQHWVRRPLAHRPHLSAGQLVFADALYLRDPLGGADGWQPASAHQAEALILLAALYDFHDFALELLSVPQIAALIPADRLRRHILRRSRRLGALGVRLRPVKAMVRAALPSRHDAWRWARGDTDFYSAAS